MSPPLSAEVREVEVSLNAQQFTTSGVTFEHYRRSRVAAAAARRSGGGGTTVFGAGFSRGRDYRCKFEGSGTEPAVVWRRWRTTAV